MTGSLFGSHSSQFQMAGKSLANIDAVLQNEKTKDLASMRALGSFGARQYRRVCPVHLVRELYSTVISSWRRVFGPGSFALPKPHPCESLYSLDLRPRLGSRGSFTHSAINFSEISSTGCDYGHDRWSCFCILRRVALQTCSNSFSDPCHH